MSSVGKSSLRTRSPACLREGQGAAEWSPPSHNVPEVLRVNLLDSLGDFLMHGVVLQAAESAGGVTSHFDLAERCRQRVVDQEIPRQAVADAQQFLQHLGRLQRADRARKGAEDPGLLAAGNQVFRRLLRKKAAIARVRISEIRLVGRHLGIEAEEGGRNEGLPKQEA